MADAATWSVSIFRDVVELILMFDLETWEPWDLARELWPRGYETVDVAEVKVKVKVNVKTGRTKEDETVLAELQTPIKQGTCGVVFIGTQVVISMSTRSLAIQWAD